MTGFADNSGEGRGFVLPLPERARLSHAYILISSGDDRLAAGRQLAAAMLCRSGQAGFCSACSDCRKTLAGIHPDVQEILRLPDSGGRPRRDVTVAQVRAVIADAAVLPNEAAAKVYLIADAAWMNVQAQNALLKLLEEPPRHVRLILCAENPGVFLDTIRSRCIELRVRSGEPVRYGEREREYLRLAAAGDRLALLRFCLSMEELSPPELAEHLRAVRMLIGETLCGRSAPAGLSPAELRRLYALCLRAERYLDSNVSARSALGFVAARTIDLE